MAMYGKRGLGGSAAVLDAPETDRGRETPWPIPEPAPAGTLTRRKTQTDAEDAVSAKADEDAYRPRRESAGHRLRVRLLRSVAGRIVGGSCVVLLLGAAAAGALSLRSSLLHDPRFVISTSSEIQIVGNRHLTRAQALSVFGSDLERNIFKIPLAQRQADLERLPWVAQATVMRLLPNQLRVAITERTPVAFVRQGSHIGLVDAGGVLLDMPEDVAGDPQYSFPVLTGLSESDPLPVRAARMEVYRHFMQDLDSSGEKVTQSLSEVDVSNPEDVKAMVTEGSADLLVHFGDEKFLQRYRIFAQNLPQWKNQYPKLASVDTRYENEFVLEMQPGSAVPLVGASSPGAVVGSRGDDRAAKAGSPLRKSGERAKAERAKAEPLVKKAARPVQTHDVKAAPTHAVAEAHAGPKPASKPVKKPILVHAYNANDSGQVKQ